MTFECNLHCIIICKLHSEKAHYFILLEKSCVLFISCVQFIVQNINLCLYVYRQCYCSL